MAEPSRTLQVEVASRTTEVAQHHSDLDIAVSTGQPIPPDQLAALREAVGEMPTLYDVDLVDLSTVGRRLKEEILRHGVQL